MWNWRRTEPAFQDSGREFHKIISLWLSAFPTTLSTLRIGTLANHGQYPYQGLANAHGVSSGQHTAPGRALLCNTASAGRTAKTGQR